MVIVMHMYIFLFMDMLFNIKNYLNILIEILWYFIK